MARPLVLSLAALVALGPGCGGGGGGSTNPSTPPSNPAIVNGCPSLVSPVARAGDPIGGDTYSSFARPFFATWCVRCHSSTLTTDAERNGAPRELNWDVESVVRANLSRIRLRAGVQNNMPPLDPVPPCAERQRLIRWIDAGAP
jgi:hypothetical protein